MSHQEEIMTNWAKTYSCKPKRIFRPKSETELRQILQTATSDGYKVKPVGSRHSPSTLWCTSDYMIDMTEFKRVLKIDQRNKTTTVEAGALLEDLVSRLRAEGLALKMLPTISDLTIGGIIATGTHGTGVKSEIVADSVLEIRVMLADGSVKVCSGAENTQLFKALQCNLGALGIILSLKLQCESHYFLREESFVEKMDAFLPSLPALHAKYDYTRFYYYPYTGFVRFNGLVKVPPPEKAPERSSDFSRFSDWFWQKLIGHHLIQLLLFLSSYFPALVRHINSFVLRMHDRTRERVRSYEEIFILDCLFSQHVMEWAIPLDNCAPAIEALAAALERDKPSGAHFTVEVRFGRADEILLSPAFGRDVCYINVVTFRPYGVEIDKEAYFATFGSIMRRLGGRPHWAKQCEMSPDEIEKLYPKFHEFAAIRAQVDPRKTFDNERLQALLGDGKIENYPNSITNGLGKFLGKYVPPLNFK